MNYVLENNNIRVEISDLGAELQSIYGKNTQFEYLWQANREDMWQNRATNIFPICGRLYNGKYTYQGKEYEMILHGFAKKSVFNVIEQSAEKISFELTENTDTLKVYPFKFLFRITFTLCGATVRTEYYVKNTGNPDLPFSVGGHPGFTVPLEDGLNFNDHYVEFEKAEKHTVMGVQNFLYSGKDLPYDLENDKILRLSHELFVNDAIFLSAKDGSATLKSDKTNRFVKISYHDITRLGLWQNLANDTPFICIEPWHGVPATDGETCDFATKKEFIHLKDGEDYINYFDITVSE